MRNEENNPQTYYPKADRAAQLHRLITLRLRNALLTLAYFNKGRDEQRVQDGLFDIVEPADEADMLVRDLVFFGFLDKSYLGEEDKQPEEKQDGDPRKRT